MHEKPTYYMTTYSDLMLEMQEFILRIHTDNVEKGHWDGEGSEDSKVREKLLLIHAEISEAAEALREQTPMRDKNVPYFTNFEVELADALIRIFDLIARTDARTLQAVLGKLDYNRTRPYKHGKLY